MAFLEQFWNNDDFTSSTANVWQSTLALYRDYGDFYSDLVFEPLITSSSSLPTTTTSLPSTFTTSTPTPMDYVQRIGSQEDDFENNTNQTQACNLYNTYLDAPEVVSMQFWLQGVIGTGSRRFFSRSQ